MTTDISPIELVNEIEQAFRVVFNHKQPGIAFYGLQSLLNQPKLWSSTISYIIAEIKRANLQFDGIIGIGSRGYIVAAILSYLFGVRMIMADKKGKLPPPVYSSSSYNTEYSKSEILEICEEAFEGNASYPKVSHVLIADDLLATGGSCKSIIDIVEQQTKCTVAGIIVLGDLKALPILKSVSKYPIIKVCSFCTDPSMNPDPMLAIRYQARQIKPRFLGELGSHSKLEDGQIAVLAHPTLYSWVKTLQNLSSSIFVPIYISWNSYPDKTPNISFADVARFFAGQKTNQVVYLLNTMDMSVLFEQLSLLYILPDYVFGSIHTVIPFYSCGTQERYSEIGQLAAGNTLAKMISAPITRGPIDLTIYDLHAPASNFNFGPAIRPNYEEASTTGIGQLLHLIDLQHTTIAFPDEGAYKRFSLLSKLKEMKLPTVVFVKRRDDKDATKRTLVLTNWFNFPEMAQERGSPLFRKELHHVLIMDDLVQSGGTLNECRKALLTEGAKYVSCYVTHAVFPNQAYKKFLPGGSFAGMNRFYVTNTNPAVTDQLEDIGSAGASARGPFYVLNLALTLSKSLLKDRVVGDETDCLFRNVFSLGSIQDVKYSALSGAIHEYFEESGIDMCQVDSKINPQPVGLTEIKQGNKNRFAQLELHRTLFANHKICMENGIVLNDSNEPNHATEELKQMVNGAHDFIQSAHDCAHILFEDCHGRNYERLSESVYLPLSIYEESKASNFQITCGEILAKKTREQLLRLVQEYEVLTFGKRQSSLEMLTEPIDPHDWHLLFGPRTRRQILKETLVALFQDYILYYSSLC